MRPFNALSWLTGLSLSIGLLVLLHQIQIPFFLYYPNTTDTVLISAPVDLYFFLITSLCVPCTWLLAPGAWGNKVRSVFFAIVVLWMGGAILLPITPYYGIPLIYVAIICLALYTFERLWKAREQSGEVAYLILGAASLLALIECASAYYWVTAAFSPQALFGVASQNLETDLTYAPYPVAPILLLIIMSSWVWIPILDWASSRFRSPKSDSYSQSTGNGPMPENTSRLQPNFRQHGLSNKRVFLLSLDILAILSLLVFYFLYAAGQMWVVGVDAQYRYIIPLNTLNGLGLSQAVARAFTLGHGVYLAILLTIDRATGLSPFLTVKYAPIVLAFATSTLTLLAFRRAQPRNFAFLAALCAVLWIPTTIGVWGAIQSNWMAYVLWMLYLVSFLGRHWKSWSASFLLQSVLSVGILLTHPWTWGVFLATLIAAAIFEIRRRADFRRALTSVVSATWLAAPICAAAYISLSGIRGDVLDAIGLYVFPFKHLDSILSLFPGAWLEMGRAWSSFLSPTLILLALVGAYALRQVSGESRRYLLAWATVWCIGSILVATIEYVPADAAISETQLWRMLYLSPLPFLLALGIGKCVNLSSRFTIPCPHRFERLQLIILPTAIAAFSLPLFLFEGTMVRLVSVIVGTLSIALLTYVFRLKDSPRLLIVIVLMLVVVNATFRSLFPLLLDPHNLYPPSSI